MPSLVIEPSAMEWVRFRPRYEELAEALEAEGYEVELVAPVEERGVAADPVTITVLVLAIISGVVDVDDLVEKVRKRLPGRRGPARQGEILLPNDEVHRFDLPDEDE